MAAFVFCQWQMINSSVWTEESAPEGREDAFPRRWLTWFTVFPSVKFALRCGRATFASVLPALLPKEQLSPMCFKEARTFSQSWK